MTGTPPGAREAKKAGTRLALVAAANQMFAERGYEQTTVRDIAEAAKVTQRTFYRYFDGKEDLIAGEFRSWLADLERAIVSRAAAEQPFTAVHRALISVGARQGPATTPAPAWMFSDRPFAGLRQSAPRPLLRLEESIARALLTRLRGAADHGAGNHPPAPDDEFTAQVIARAAVAGLRSAIIRHRELRRRGRASPGVEQLLGRAFAVMVSQAPDASAVGQGGGVG